jgi:hypothetical protein
MPSRIGPRRVWFGTAILAALLAGLFAGPSAAQPPSPLELVRGLRENGQVDLALEYLKEIEGKPLSPEDKAAILLERAKCLLDVSEEEPDEGTRLGMVAEAKEALNAFLLNNSRHPRAVEALLAVAKLTSLDAKNELNRARRMDIPPLGDSEDEKRAYEQALEKQKAEAARARPLFLLASKRFAEASKLLRERLADKGLDFRVRRALEREAFEAELASGINQFNIAETFMRPNVEERKQRDGFLVQAKETFDKLAKGPASNRTVWTARAWSAEVTYEQDKFNEAAAEVANILRAGVLEAEEGKRLARFFQLRRNFLLAVTEKNLTQVRASETELRRWLGQFGNPRKPTPELFAVRYYLAYALQHQAETAIGPVKDPAKPPAISPAARKQLEEAEKLYRVLAQSDHDYTARAARNRMAVVRRLLGEADQPAASYDTFERAQMASLIQMSKLATAEARAAKTPEEEKKKEAEVRDRRLRAIALLERSRELAGPQDSPADVTDVLLRLIYFYQQADQPYQSAVLGEFVARTVKATGGKASLAGLLAINGYVTASAALRLEDPEAAAAARQADRERAIAVARFLDTTYPNDNATDAARHRLASLLLDEDKPLEAFEVLTRVRPGYAQITNVRLLEGYLAGRLVAPAKSELTQERKAEIFKRAVADLVKVPQPAAIAAEEDVRGYLSARCRLAVLLFAQGRADPAAEAANPGHDQALTIATQTIAAVPTFESMVEPGADGKLNLDGLEMTLLAQDAQARAVYLRARALTDAGKLDEAAKTLEPTLQTVRAGGAAFTPELKEWAKGGGGDADAAQKARVAQIATAVDRTRVDVILAAFRLQVKQGKSAEAKALLDLMLKAGGTVEDNLPVLELMGRELAGQLAVAQREGKAKAAEATNLEAGLAVLLDKITTVPKLPQSSVLFIGQALQTVKKYDQAIETLKKVPEPAFPEWKTKKTEDFPQEVRGQLINQTRDYALANLYTARALRGGKKLAEAEALLTGIIGTNDKQGWGYGRLYFRKELAEVYEDKGKAEPDVKKANAEWGKALQTWTTLFQIQRNRLAKPPAGANAQQMIEYRNAFADAYFDVQRCLVEANQQLLKGQPAEKLQKTYDDVARRFTDMEKQIPAADWDPEVRNRYADLLDKVEPLKSAYKAAGGKLFLE